MGETIWIGARETADIIGVHISQVHRMIKSGLFHSVRRASDKPRARYLLDLDEVEAAKYLYHQLRVQTPRCGARTLYERDVSRSVIRDAIHSSDPMQIEYPIEMPSATGRYNLCYSFAGLNAQIVEIVNFASRYSNGVDLARALQNTIKKNGYYMEAVCDRGRVYLVKTYSLA